jgi:hypothetical protein
MARVLLSHFTMISISDDPMKKSASLQDRQRMKQGGERKKRG